MREEERLYEISGTHVVCVLLKKQDAPLGQWRRTAAGRSCGRAKAIADRRLCLRAALLHGKP